MARLLKVKLAASVYVTSVVSRMGNENKWWVKFKIKYLYIYI